MKKVKEFMREFIVEVEHEENISNVAKVMKEKNVSSVLVKKGQEYVGIVTEKDILYKVVAEGKDPSKVKVNEIMSSPLITISSDSSLDQALTLFKEKKIRRLPVKENNKIIGMLTLMSLVGDLKAAESVTEEVEQIKGHICAFCGSIFKDEKELSKHIDRIHIGAGVLEFRR